MNRILRSSALLALACLLYAPDATAQLAQIQLIPNQTDRMDVYTNGAAVVEASNGDIVAIIVESGEFTNTSQFPWEGTPANLVVHRTTDAGATWEEKTTLRTGIDDYGTQGIGRPRATVLPSGRIILTILYTLDVFPNYDVQLEIYTSDDHGATWDLLNTREPEVASLNVMPSGTILALDFQNEYSEYWWSTSPDGGDTWTTGAFVTQTGPICGSVDLVAVTDTEWIFSNADCAFGPGGTNHVYIRTTQDAGATWSDPVEVTTARSGFGTLGGLVQQDDGTFWLVYADEFQLTYRTATFEDGEMTIGAPTVWTVGTSQSRDSPPIC
ncbi:MAG: exo-alpha-sialidase, partial [Rhodothermales bacterium]|nr:exo-alpha-sialidase [Rhodothermales bacterium]